MKSSNRVKLSGASFWKQHKIRKDEEKRSAKYMLIFLVRNSNNSLFHDFNRGSHSNSCDYDKFEPAKEDITIDSDTYSDSDINELIEETTAGVEDNDQTIDSNTTHPIVAMDIFEDAGLWPIPITDSLRCELIARGKNRV